MAQALEFATARIVDGDTRIPRCDPQPAETIPRQHAHPLQVRRVAQQGGLFEPSGLRVAENHAAAIGRDPQPVFARGERRNPAVRQRVCVAAIVAQLAEVITVEAVETVLGPEPHEPLVVLHDGVHGLLGEAFLETVTLDAEGWSRDGVDGKGHARRHERGARETGEGPDFSPRYGHLQKNGRLQPVS
jgi:hypothetical protein